MSNQFVIIDYVIVVIIVSLFSLTSSNRLNETGNRIVEKKLFNIESQFNLLNQNYLNNQTNSTIINKNLISIDHFKQQNDNYKFNQNTTTTISTTTIKIYKTTNSNSTIKSNDYLINLINSNSSYKLSPYLIKFNLTDQYNSSILNNKTNFIEQLSTPISILNRSKRSTTANYRFKNRDNYKPSNTQSAKSSSIKYHHHLDKFILNQAKLTNDLNNAEITYKLPKYTTNNYLNNKLTTDNLLINNYDLKLNKIDNQFYTLKPNLSNTLTPSLDLFTSSLSSLPNYDNNLEEQNFYTNKYDNKITNLFENTATSLLPLLLFDRHQLAQEFKLTTINDNFLNLNTTSISTPNPLKQSTINHKSNYHYKNQFNKTNNHKYLDNKLINQLTTTTNHYRHNRHKEFLDKNNVEFNQKTIKLSTKLPIDLKSTIKELNLISLTTSVPNIDNKYLINFDINESNNTFYLNDQPINDNYINKLTTIKDDNKKLILNKFNSPSNLQSDRHHSKLGLLSINSINKNLSINSLSNGTLKSNDSSILSPAIQNVVVILLGLVIIITIIGNFLVCLSPIYFRKLRHPSNYLLISLAVSDLGVACLVMPIALFKELHDDWLLGDLICDIWLGLDIVCCTASILHLCLICIDRYLTITRPFTYAVRRKSSRSWFLISIVWILAIGICLPPLLVLGNEHGTAEKPICGYCNLFGYQLYATLGAFYIPLGVMLILYYKIYEAAKKVIEAEHKSQCNPGIKIANKSNQKKYSSNYLSKSTANTKQSNNKINTCQAHSTTTTTANNLKLKNDLQNSTVQLKKSIDTNESNLIKQPNTAESLIINCTSCGRSFNKEQKINSNHLIEKKNEITIENTIESNKLKENSNEINNLEFSNQEVDSVNNDYDDYKLKKNRKLKKKTRTPESKKYTNTNQPLLESTKHNEQLNNLEFIDNQSIDNLCEQCLQYRLNDKNNNEDTINDLNDQLVLECNQEHNTDRLPTNLTNSKFDQYENFDTNNKLINKKIKSKLKKDQLTKNEQKIKNRNINLNLAHQQISNQTSSNKRTTNSSLRERKASITLGVIMCAFIFCWLPFFILALLRPFVSELIPDWASSLTLWLGYLNSMLNPLIYVTFHQDFRKAFKYILLCRCKVMKSSMRKEAYNMAYG